MASTPVGAQRSKSIKGKRVLPVVPGGTPRDKSPSVTKSVTFNRETAERSIGGTQSVAKLKNDPLSLSISLSVNEEICNSSTSEEESVLREKVPTPKQPSRLPVYRSPVVNGGGTPRSKSPLLWNSDNKENFLTPVKDGRRATMESHIDMPSPDQFYNSNMRTPARRYTLDDKLLATPECYSTVQMDLSRHEMMYDKETSLYEEDSSSVTVAVRVRPYSSRELSDGNVRCVVSMDGNETMVRALDSGHLYRFNFDFSFWSFDSTHWEFAGQERVYRQLAQPLLVKAFEGYNTCLFAYGQTGSGKSYSIMGHGSEVGIIPRFCKELFSRADQDQEVTRDSEMVKINVEISFFEIYNEKIHDLLASCKEKGGKKPTLKVREHPVLGPYVEGLSTYVVNSFEDVEGWITLGNKNRATAATGMNDKSSRSHSVFTLVLTQTRTEEIEGIQHDHSITSKINLVDLAGSERQSQAQTSGERLREGANINKSLLTLGKVISSLSEQSIMGSKKKKSFIPYRDSVLTWLLKESLGGNSKTAMIATISPSHLHIEETLSTLRYAKQARAIVNLARVNEDPKARMIRELKSEIDRLRSQSGVMNEQQQSASLAEIAALKEKLAVREKEMEEMTRSWLEKLRLSEERKAEEAKQLEKAGITFKVDNKLPNLVNLNEDPQLSEMLLYVIKEGQTRVGRMCPSSKHEIQLSGALIADNHCIINNEECVVSITPIDDSPTYVNGNLISEPTILHHGDRVILGGDHYFRFNHPIEVSNKQTTPAQQEMKDFEFAKQEVQRVQEARLQAELEEARKQAKEEMFLELEEAKREAEMEWHSQKTGYEDKLTELEQSRQEAQEFIQKLQKQKMLLEQEVLAGRKRQQLEAKAAEKVASQPDSARGSRLLEFLETEKQKAAQRIEEVKQRRSEMMSITRRNGFLESGKTDLYKVALLLREANKISQLLKKHTTFCRFDYLEEDRMKTKIKVTNTKLGVCTFWSVVKFEDKLMQMRDLYQNDADSCVDDELFNDPSDKWEQDVSGTPGKIPKSRLHRRSSVTSPYRTSISSFNASLMKGSVSSMPDCLCPHHTPTESVLSVYKTHALSVMESFQSVHLEESIADKITGSCSKIKNSVLKIRDYQHSVHNDSISEGQPEDVIQTEGLELVTNLQSLTACSAVWSSMYMREQLQSAIIHDLTHKLRDQVKVIGNQVVLFFQGCESEIESLIQESSCNILDNVMSVCRITGELALATDTRMVSLEVLQSEDSSPTTDKLSSEVCQSFLMGCDELVDKSLQGAISSLEELETKAQQLADISAAKINLGEVPRSVEIIIGSAKDLLEKCQEVQVEIDMSVRESFQSIPASYYSLSYKRCRGLVTQISNLLETINLLMQSIQPVVQGKDSDVRKLCRCAELIQKGALRLISTTSKDKVKDADLSDISVLSDSQSEQLELAARELCSAIKSLIDQTEKLAQVETPTTTPRGKRLLPVSPDKALASSLKRNISLIRTVGNSDVRQRYVRKETDS
ncbi:kinesin-like protein KIF14 [Saccostrea cucullata]|uniref:kinesin-like protein KIF14 n=1 Tax=Saccostrea cuccullata TaxID=36930 RepID=UPI002ED52F4D